MQPSLTHDEQMEIQKVSVETVEHINKERRRGEQLMTPSPAKVANHRLLLDSEGNPKFSVEQVTFALGSGRVNATKWSVEITPVHNAPERVDADTVLLSAQSANSGQATSPAVPQNHILYVEVESMGGVQLPINVREYPSITEVQKYLRSNCGEGHITFVHPISQAKTLLIDDKLFRQVLENQWPCTFGPLRHLSPVQGRELGSQQNAPTADTVSRCLFGRDSSQSAGTEHHNNTQWAGKLHAYELSLQKYIRDTVGVALAAQPLGKSFPLQARTVSETLKSLRLLSKRWGSIEAKAQEMQDVVPIAQRLHCFLDAIVDHMDPTLRTK